MRRPKRTSRRTKRGWKLGKQPVCQSPKMTQKTWMKTICPRKKTRKIKQEYSIKITRLTCRIPWKHSLLTRVPRASRAIRAKSMKRIHLVKLITIFWLFRAWIILVRELNLLRVVDQSKVSIDHNNQKLSALSHLKDLSVVKKSKAHREALIDLQCRLQSSFRSLKLGLNHLVNMVLSATWMRTSYPR